MPSTKARKPVPAKPDTVPGYTCVTSCYPAEPDPLGIINNNALELCGHSVGGSVNLNARGISISYT